MVQIMNDHKADNTDLITGEVYVDMSDLLSIIEKAGMIPPIEPGRTVYDLDLGLPEWEPENE